MCFRSAGRGSRVSYTSMSMPYADPLPSEAASSSPSPPSWVATGRALDAWVVEDSSISVPCTGFARGEDGSLSDALALLSLPSALGRLPERPSVLGRLPSLLGRLPSLLGRLLPDLPLPLAVLRQGVGYGAGRRDIHAGVDRERAWLGSCQIMHDAAQEVRGLPDSQAAGTYWSRRSPPRHCPDTRALFLLSLPSLVTVIM